MEEIVDRGRVEFSGTSDLLTEKIIRVFMRSITNLGLDFLNRSIVRLCGLLWGRLDFGSKLKCQFR
jgi:hypothetical protein